MPDRLLSESQLAFLDAFFDPEIKGDPKKAANVAGYDPFYGYKLARDLRDEIIERAEYYIAVYSPKAAMRLAEGLDADGSQPGQMARMEAAKQILDRVGVSKKDRLEIKGEGMQGIMILPAKRDE